MDNKVKDESGQTTPDLDVIMKEGLQQFNVIVEPGTAEPENDTNKGPAATEKVVAAAATEKDKGDPNPNPAAAAAETKRFTSHDDAEKGYKHLQSDFTRVTQENAELKKKLSAQEVAEQQKKTAETAIAEFETFATDRRTKLLDEIDALDPDEPDYRKKVANAQARADADILKAGQKFSSTTPIPAVTEAPAAKVDTAAPAGTKVNPDQVRDYVREKISSPEIGIEADDILFWSYAANAPDKDEKGQSIPLDDQIKWAVEQTKQYHSRIKPVDQNQVITETGKTAAANASREMPLGRASTAVPGSTADSDAPVSLSDAIDAANNLRRL